jgi:hypothetical protein
MKIYFSLLILFSLLTSAVVNTESAGISHVKKGWQSLFDGKSLNGWRRADRNLAPDSGWYVEKGVLTFDPAKGHGGDIITTKTFKNFDLSIQFKVSEGGNSGIKYFLIPNTSLGCEYQIIDDSKHADAALGINGNRKAGSLYDVLPANPKKKYKPAGEWNTARIVANGQHVEHWLNGSKVLEFERGSEEFKKAIQQSKFKTTKGFAEATTTAILLQAHGDKVSFRNIKIKEL